MASWLSSMVCSAPAPEPCAAGWYVARAAAPILSRPGGPATGAVVASGERIFVTEGIEACARLFRGGWVDAASLDPEAASGGATAAKGSANAAAFASAFDAELAPDMGDLMRTNSIGPPAGFLEHYDGYAPDAGWYAVVAPDAGRAAIVFNVTSTCLGYNRLPGF